VKGRRQDWEQLHRFRNDVYDCLPARADALFELVDDVCCPVAVDGIAHLTLAPAAWRGHGAVYAALACGDIDTEQLRDVLADHRPGSGRGDFAIDASVWARCDAECSPGRGFYYHPSRHSAGQPIQAGWCYSWLVGLSQAPDSWTAPLDVRRLAVSDNPNLIAVAQMRALGPRLGKGDPLFAFDGGYDPVQLTVELGQAPAQIVVRIRDDRSFWGRPPRRLPGGKGGRPARHGARFRCADPTTWPAPDAHLACDDEVYSHVEVTAWHRLHPKQRTYREGFHLAIVEGTVIRLAVSHLPGRGDRAPKTLWLWWHGPDPDVIDLDRIWRAYIRRFDIEHMLRFSKQVLGWTTPKLRTPAQADRWSWIIVAAWTQLRLAKPLVADHRLPWQRPQPTEKMTPGRVRAGFGHLLPHIGTPASAPKPCRAGPGRPRGSRNRPTPRYPALKKRDIQTN
jgi:hypothetical protein